MMYRIFRLERLKLIRRLGRRGALLILFGFAWIMIGGTSLFIPQDRFSSPGIGPDRILQTLDGPELSLLWVISGAIAMTVGAFHDRRIINRHEALGWNAILTMPLIWQACFIWSFIVWVISDGESGRANSLYGSVVWGTITLIILIMSGWPEEDFTRPGHVVTSADGPEVDTVEE